MRRGAFVYSTYLGGSSEDEGRDIAVDASGNVYVTGGTVSIDFPTVNPLQAAFRGVYDAYVTKLNPEGSAFVYSTYLDGTDFDYGLGIAVDASGNAYLTGYTLSTDFPTRKPLQAANGGNYDAYVAKVNPAGSALVYSTYLGGSSVDFATRIAVDASGAAYVAGETGSTNFPTRKPFQAAHGGVVDGFVAKLTTSLVGWSALAYSSYLGGNDSDGAYGVAADTSGAAYVTGYTASDNFPLANPLQPVRSGLQDVFVSKIGTSP